MFVDWVKERKERTGRNPSWNFKSIHPVPRQTISVGFFAYPENQVGEKLFRVSRTDRSVWIEVLRFSFAWADSYLLIISRSVLSEFGTPSPN